MARLRARGSDSELAELRTLRRLDSTEGRAEGNDGPDGFADASEAEPLHSSEELCVNHQRLPRSRQT